MISFSNFMRFILRALSFLFQCFNWVHLPSEIFGYGFMGGGELFFFPTYNCIASLATAIRF